MVTSYFVQTFKLPSLPPCYGIDRQYGNSQLRIL